MSRSPDPVVQARARGQFVADAHAENEHRRRRRRQQARAPPDGDDDADAYSIKCFCLRHNISEALFFKLRALGLGPTVMRVGARVLISRESAAAWRRSCEIAAHQQKESTAA